MVICSKAVIPGKSFYYMLCGWEKYKNKKNRGLSRLEKVLFFQMLMFCGSASVSYAMYFKSQRYNASLQKSLSDLFIHPAMQQETFKCSFQTPQSQTALQPVKQPSMCCFPRTFHMTRCQAEGY